MRARVPQRVLRAYINIKKERSTAFDFFLEYLLRSGICFVGGVSSCEGLE